MFKIKTPHRRPLRHLVNLYLFFLLGSFVTVFFHLGLTAGAAPDVSSFLALSETSLCVAAAGLAGGIAVTAIVRRLFNLLQTGRIVQYAGFWLASLAGLKLANHCFGTITITAPLVASFLVFAIAFGLATVLGEVPWRGRKWLPVRAKSRAAVPSSATDNTDQPPKT